MNSIKERTNDRVRYERDNEYDYSYTTRRFDDARYSESRRATNENRYVSDFDIENDYYYGNSSKNYDNKYFESKSFYEDRPVYSNNQRNRTKTKKSKMNGKAKLLIVVYFAIFALITTLILVNAIPKANAQVKDNINPEIIINETVINNDALTGEALILAPTAPEYKYDTKTNWFDGFCDWIENLFS